MSRTDAGELLLHAARGLAPDISIVRDEIDHARRLPLHLVEKLHTAGLLQLWLPGAFGGPEIHPAEFVDVIEALAIADGAVGWCASNAAGFSLLAGGLSEAAAHAIYDERGIVAGSINPTGRAIAVAGGF